MSFAQHRERMRQQRGSNAKANGNKQLFKKARQTGQLNMSNRELKRFPEDVLRLHETLEEDERSWECEPLKKLDLSLNEMEELSSNISTLEFLSTLNVRHNKLYDLPTSFWSLQNLTSIDLSHNLLHGELPSEVCQLTKLRDLDLSHNNLTALPESIGQLTSLESLQLDSNRLTQLPSAIGDLTNLRTLSIHSNQLRELPSTFQQLVKVTSLNLKGNRIVSTGTIFAQMQSLRVLDLNQNRLDKFPLLPEAPNSLDELSLGANLLRTLDVSSLLRAQTTLTILTVRDNKLYEVPDKVAHLVHLKTLDLSNNDLQTLPPGLGYLKQLNHLLVDGNPMRSIRRAIVQAGTVPLLKYLRTRGPPPEGVDTLEAEMDDMEVQMKQRKGELDLSKNETLFRDAAASGELQLTDMQLQELPSELMTRGKYDFMAKLKHLDLSKNQLTSLPSEIGDLQELRTLVAEDCGLEALDASVAKLPHLRRLQLSKNALTTDALDAFLSTVSCPLEELDISHNALTAIPTSITKLTKLHTLILASNKIMALDGIQWKEMAHLSILNVSNNALESVGDVHTLPSLTSLSVENNSLRQIPPELAQCPQLRALMVTGNPQRAIRPEIIQQGSDAILAYLRSRLPEQQTTTTDESMQPQEEPSEQEEKTEAPKGPTETMETESVAASTSSRSEASSSSSGRSRSSSGVRAVRPRDAFEDTIPKRIRRYQEPTSTVFPWSASPDKKMTKVTGADADAVEQVVKELDDKIATLERQLEDFSVSDAKKALIKKDLMKARSQRNRQVKQLQSEA